MNELLVNQRHLEESKQRLRYRYAHCAALLLIDSAVTSCGEFMSKRSNCSFSIIPASD